MKSGKVLLGNKEGLSDKMKDRFDVFLDTYTDNKPIIKKIDLLNFDQSLYKAFYNSQLLSQTGLESLDSKKCFVFENREDGAKKRNLKLFNDFFATLDSESFGKGMVQNFSRTLYGYLDENDLYDRKNAVYFFGSELKWASSIIYKSASELVSEKYARDIESTIKTISQRKDLSFFVINKNIFAPGVRKHLVNNHISFSKYDICNFVGDDFKMPSNIVYLENEILKSKTLLKISFFLNEYFLLEKNIFNVLEFENFKHEELSGKVFLKKYLDSNIDNVRKFIPLNKYMTVNELEDEYWKKVHEIIGYGFTPKIRKSKLSNLYKKYKEIIDI